MIVKIGERRYFGKDLPTKKISKKVLNCLEFKSICYNKNKMHEIIGEFMPKSFRIKNLREFEKKIKLFPLTALKAWFIKVMLTLLTARGIFKLTDLEVKVVGLSKLT